MRLILLGVVLILGGCVGAPERRGPQPPASAVFEVAAVSGLGLFADEQARAQALLARAFLDRGVLVANPEAINRAWAMAAEGRDPLTGVVCGMPLNASSALERWGSALGLGGRIDTGVTCPNGVCRLVIGGVSLEGYPVDRLDLEAPVDSGADALSALDTALQRLVVRKAELRPSVTPDGRRLRKVDALQVHVTPADHRENQRVDETVFQSLAPESFLSCFDEHLDLLVETSAHGEVARCEGQSLSDMASTACACQQLKAVRWGPGRWGVALDLMRRDELTDDGRLMLRGTWLKSTELVGDNSIKDWTPGSARMATGCFGKVVRKPGQMRSKWAVWFDDLGQATKATEQKSAAPLQSDVASCVEEALMKSRAPCPSRKGLWAMVELVIDAGAR